MSDALICDTFADLPFNLFFLVHFSQTHSFAIKQIDFTYKYVNSKLLIHTETQLNFFNFRI